MKKFEDFCYMTQEGVKAYMKKFLSSKNYEVIDEKGFLYAKGDVPVLLVAHMDTVHKQRCTQIVKIGEKMSSPQGIGGDDRCGIFIIANLVKKYHCSVLLCEDEEIGTVGAREFIKTDYVKNLGVNFMIEFDRKGNNDAVFYSCDNKDFTNHVLDHTGFKEARGSFTDISVLMPASKLCGVNLSSGYYNAHSPQEYVIYEEMFDTMNAAKALIEAECPEPFEYVAKKYTTYGSSYNNNYNQSGSGYRGYHGVLDDYYGYDDDVYGHSSFGNNQYRQLNSGAPTKEEDLPTKISKDLYLELTATIINEAGQQEFLFASGRTKSECWVDLLTSYPGVCMDDILEYEWE
jgi:hypothetical protein